MLDDYATGIVTEWPSVNTWNSVFSRDVVRKANTDVHDGVEKKRVAPKLGISEEAADSGPGFVMERFGANAHQGKLVDGSLVQAIKVAMDQIPFGSITEQQDVINALAGIYKSKPAWEKMWPPARDGLRTRSETLNLIIPN